MIALGFLRGANSIGPLAIDLGSGRKKLRVGRVASTKWSGTQIDSLSKIDAIRLTQASLFQRPLRAEKRHWCSVSTPVLHERPGWPRGRMGTCREVVRAGGQVWGECGPSSQANGGGGCRWPQAMGVFQRRQPPVEMDVRALPLPPAAFATTTTPFLTVFAPAADLCKSPRSFETSLLPPVLAEVVRDNPLPPVEMPSPTTPAPIARAFTAPAALTAPGRSAGKRRRAEAAPRDADPFSARMHLPFNGEEDGHGFAAYQRVGLDSNFMARAFDYCSFFMCCGTSPEIRLFRNQN